MLVVFTNLATGERQEALQSLVGGADAPVWDNPDLRRPKDNRDPAAFKGTIGAAFMVNLALLNLRTADYTFYIQLGELRSNELRISVVRPGKK
jgi:hypothetical protein